MTRAKQARCTLATQSSLPPFPQHLSILSRSLVETGRPARYSIEHVKSTISHWFRHLSDIVSGIFDMVAGPDMNNDTEQSLIDSTALPDLRKVQRQARSPL